MNNYESPELKVTLFKNDEVITASSETSTETTKKHGVALPDDDWSV